MGKKSNAAQDLALFTDLYELTMAQAYDAEGMDQPAVFELFFRLLPEPRNYMVAAGLQDVLSYLEGLRFTLEELEYLKGFIKARKGYMTMDATERVRYEREPWYQPAYWIDNYEPVLTEAELDLISRIEAREKELSTGNFPNQNGRIVAIHFAEGARVRKGELLVKLNDADLQAMRLAATLELDLARLAVLPVLLDRDVDRDRRTARRGRARSGRAATRHGRERSGRGGP